MDTVRSMTHGVRIITWVPNTDSVRRIPCVIYGIKR